MDSLMISEVLHTLEQQGKLIAFDAGEHFRCFIDSNCPRAVELRKIILEMGVDWKTLRVAEEPQAFSLNAVDFQPITAQVMIGNTPVDASALIREEAHQGLRMLINNLENRQNQIARLGRAYNKTYQDRVYEIRKQGRLTQLSFSLADMVKYNCKITTDAEAKNYLMCFGILYQPKYTYHNGQRYEITPAYAKPLERDVWVVYKVAKDRTITEMKLVLPDGRKFQHYHGNDAGDCWGQNERLHKWDGTLKQLGDKAFVLSRALGTVNMDSLLNRSPEGMPSPTTLQAHTKLLGEEGRMAEPAPTTPTPAATPNRWGARNG